MVCMCYRQGHQQSKTAGASSSQARGNPRTSLSALDCGCDAPALPVGYNKLTWNCKPIHPFLPEVSLGQGVFLASTDMKQGQPVNRLAAHLSQARNTLDNQ